MRSSQRRWHSNEGLRMDIWDRWMERRGLFQECGVWGMELYTPKCEREHWKDSKETRLLEKEEVV